jgi:hypothetical protein
MKKATEGLVIEGTMRNEDLIHAFLDVLQELDPTRFVEIMSRFPNKGGLWTMPDMDSDDACEFVDELFDILEEYAPDGCYFGAIEGDGCCYGFWRFDDESLDETNKTGD